MIMQSILSAQDSKAAAREMTIRVKNITSQLPGEMQQIANVPTIVAGLNQSSTPEDAAKVLKQLNDLQTGFQQGGWEAYMKSGGTVVGGGNEAPDITANLSGVQTALDQLGPYFGLMDVSRVRAQDILSRAGWTPEQIQAQTGRYLNPTELALNANTQSYTHGDRQPVYSQFNPTLNAALRPASLQTPGPGQNLPGGIAGPGGLQQLISGGQADPSGLAQLSAPERQALGLDPTRGYTNQDLANFFAPSGAGAGLIGPSALGLGTTVKGVESQLAGLQPGNLEQGITGLLGQYGGVSPLWQQMGFGQGLPAPQAPVPTASPVTSGVPTDASSLVAGLQRLIGKTGGQAGALNPSVPSEFSTALQNPAALQSLLNQPGLLARLFQGGQ